MQEQDKEKLIVFDTTLRDGEQSAGGAMRVEDKVTVAKQLERLGVDVIEAGFPISSPGDMQAVKQIAATVKHSCVCALARANDDDVDAGLEAIADARQPRLHTFIATSKLHMAKKLGLEPDAVLERAVRAVARARNATADVEFSAEDAGRSDIDFLCRIIEAAIKAGASTINIPDTVGYTMPDEFAQRVRELIERVPNSDKAVFSVHCHNDLGVGVANSLAAIQVGARQVECTINGIGERAGNAALEEIVMAIRTRNALFPCEVGINAAELVPTSQLVEKVTGIQVQANKAVVGINAFAHESGIHQDGVLKSRETYEIMRAEDVGWDSNRIQLGKLSGRRAFKQRLAELEFQLEGSSFDQAFSDFKNLADSQRLVSDDDLIRIASRHAAPAEKVAR